MPPLGTRSAKLRNIPFDYRCFQSMNIKTSRINGHLHVLSILPISQQHSRAEVCIDSARKVEHFRFISRVTPVS